MEGDGDIHVVVGDGPVPGVDMIKGESRADMASPPSDVSWKDHPCPKGLGFRV